MEQFVLGIFQEQLSKFLVGFKKEQVNANLLNGKGQIRDVNLNCSFINDRLRLVAPFFSIESILVSKLGFHVTSWTNLKKAPILVDIEDVHIKIIEPLTFVDKKDRLSIKQLSWIEFRELFKDKKDHRGPYNLFDRIIDNLQIEIQSVNISFQSRGRFKTMRDGPWTPPSLHVRLTHLKYCSVDEYGNEADPDDCWRHNKFLGHPRDQTLLVYKKASLQSSVFLQQAGEDTKEPLHLVNDAHVELNFAFHRKFINGAILSIQLDVTVNQVEINVDKEAIPLLFHVMLGLKYCFTKDRAFEDPLWPHTSVGDTDENVQLSNTPALSSDTPTGSSVDGDDSNNDDHIDRETDKLQDNTGQDFNDDDSQSVGAEECSIDGSANNSDFDAEDRSDEDYEPPLDLTSGNADIETAMLPMEAQRLRKSKDRPVIILPSGLIIYGKVSISVSIHDCKVRINYGISNGGYIQLHLKGLVGEVIWPKVTREKGCYIQISLSFLTMQEVYRNSITTLLMGGTQQDRCRGPIESPLIPGPELPSEESFPYFEKRSIRPDPLDVRQSFPVQAVGIKVTVNFVDNMFEPEREEIVVLNEIGISVLDVIAHTESLCRAVQFALHDNGDGFDPRWQSGDWSNVIPAEMMRNTLQPLSLSNHLQIKHEAELGENDMIASDLINVTAKFAKITVKVPAALEQDLRSCDIIAQIDELMLTVSSALPRKFLKGKITTSTDEDGSIGRMSIQFPNDPSDICYSQELNSIGPVTSPTVSTFRAQVVTKGLTVKALPFIPLFETVASQNILDPVEMTMLLSLEGESENSDSESIKMLWLYSIRIVNLDINCNFELLAGAMSTALHRLESITSSINASKNSTNFANPSVHLNGVGFNTGSCGDDLDRSGGRKKLMLRQFDRSQRTGGLTVVVSVQVNKLCLQIWRLNVPRDSLFRTSIAKDSNHFDDCPIPLLRLLTLLVNNLEIALETSIKHDESRSIVKSCVSQIEIDVCDFAKARLRQLDSGDGTSNETVNHEGHKTTDKALGKHALDEDVEDLTFPSRDTIRNLHHDSIPLVKIGNESEKDILIRLEKCTDQGTSVTIAVDMDVGGVINLHIHEIELLFLFVVEAMLLPTKVKPLKVCEDGGNNSNFQFPAGSVGHLFENTFRLGKGSDDVKENPVDVEKIADDGNTMARLIQGLTMDAMPNDYKEFFVRFTIGDLLIFVPHHAKDNRSTAVDGPWLGYQLREASLLTGFIRSNSAKARCLLDRLVQHGVAWSCLFPDPFCGVHHKIHASQGLYSAELEGSDVALRKTIIDAFDLCMTCDRESIKITVGDSSLSIQDLDNIKNIYSSMIAFIHRIKLMLHRIESVTRALTSKSEESHIISTDKLTSTLLEEAEISLQIGKTALARLVPLFDSHDARMRARIASQQREIAKLHEKVFLKERSLIAALGLVSCQAAGWLRVGGAHMTGERSQSVSSLWRYHGILRKSLLLLYHGPGKTRPVDVINLEGASLRTVTGGRRRRDVKNAFAIQERGGCIRYVLAPNGRELDFWLEQLQKTVKTYKGDSFIEDDDDSNEVTEILDNDIHRSRTLSSDAGSVEDGSSHGATSKSKRGQNMKERLSKATAITRSSLNTAINAAKQRGVQKFSRKSGEDGDTMDFLNPLPLGASSQSLENLDADIRSEDQSFAQSGSAVIEAAYLPDNEASFYVPDTKNQMLGSLRSKTKLKLGSALQGAREKALAVAEERRRRQQDRENAEGGVRRGLRDRIGNAANNVKLSFEKTDVFASAKNERTLSPSDDEQSDYHATGIITDVSKSIVGSSDTTLESEGFETEGFSSAMLGEGPTPPATSIHRSRFSKIGAAVKNVAQGNQIARAPILVEGETDTGKPGRFSLRRGNRQGDGIEEPDMVKLKAIRVGGSINPNERPNDNTLSSLAKIKGQWVVLVQSRNSETIQESSSCNVDDLEDINAGTYRAVDKNVDPTSTSIADVEPTLQIPVNEILDVEQPEQPRSQFNIRVFSRERVSQKKIEVSTILRGFQDVLGLYIDVFESLHEVPVEVQAFESSDVASNLGVSPLDILKVTGEIIGGLLSASPEFHSIASYQEYLCEVLTEFLNAALQSPMYISGCIAVLEFLEIVDAGVMPLATAGDETSLSLNTSSCHHDEQQDLASYVSEIRALTDSCLTNLARADASGMLKQKLGHRQLQESDKEKASIRRSASMPVNVPFLEPLLPQSIAEKLREAMHKTLKKVMMERDEAQATLIASSVMHVHEIERERKHGDLVKRKLSFAQAEALRLQQGNFFADRFKDPRAQQTKEIENHLEEMVKRSDQEIESLSKQLSKEIADKTAAKLEIQRLKDLMAVARSSDSVEKEALAEELRKTRELLTHAQAEASASNNIVKELQQKHDLALSD